MLRPFLSLLVAGATTAGGLALTWFSGSTHTVALQTFEPDPTTIVIGLVGSILLAAAALSIALHWVGALVVGAIHALLGLLALVVPFAGGTFSPVFQITRMLFRADPVLADGATVFYFSGTALVIGAFLVGAALGIRSRLLAGRSSAKAVRVSSAVSAIALVAAAALLIVAGGAFVQQIVVLMRHDNISALIVLVAALFAGVAGLLLRWSSFGVILPATVILAAGVAFFVAMSPPPPSFPGRLPATYGLVMVAGATFLAAAVAGAVRGRSEVLEAPTDL